MFLNQVLDDPQVPWALRNRRTGEVLARHLEPAFDSRTRRRGLLGRQGLAADSAMILAPCNSIHTFFMQFPIDVVFAARDGRVVKLRHAMPARRLALGWKAFAVIELPAGTLQASGTKLGDLLQIVR